MVLPLSPHSLGFTCFQIMKCNANMDQHGLEGVCIGSESKD